jgi:hypothetical protein
MFEGTNRGPLKLFERSGETRLLDCPAQAWQAESVQLCHDWIESLHYRVRA